MSTWRIAGGVGSRRDLAHEGRLEARTAQRQKRAHVAMEAMVARVLMAAGGFVDISTDVNRIGLPAVVLGNFVYFSPGGNHTDYTPPIFVASTNQFYGILSYNRLGNATAAVGHQVLFTGGEGPAGGVTIYNEVDTSLKAVPLSVPRAGMAAVVSGNRAILAGGSRVDTGA